MTFEHKVPAGAVLVHKLHLQKEPVRGLYVATDLVWLIMYISHLDSRGGRVEKCCPVQYLPTIEAYAFFINLNFCGLFKKDGLISKRIKNKLACVMMFTIYRCTLKY